jgi:hypothetical protein
MQVSYYLKTGTHLNTTETFYIYKEASSEDQLNDKHTIFPKVILDAIIKIGNP